MKALVLIILMGYSSAWASKPLLEVLPFSAWKQQQIVRNQNEVVRLTNELLMSKSSNHKIVSGDEKIINPNEDVTRQDEVGQGLKQARQNLEIAKELEFDDYLEIHMEVLMTDQGALKHWLAKLSKDELVRAFQYLAKRRNQGLPMPIDVGSTQPVKVIKTN